MGKIVFLAAAILLFSSFSEDDKYITRFETSNGLQSAPYFEGIDWWNSLASGNKHIAIETYGATDAGYPLHLITLSKEGLSFRELNRTKRTVILINNAIHPGEPDGVDANMLLFRDIASERNTILDSVVVVCIPYYNIGGALNRNSFSRANQNGPTEYGFRGNAQNLDLNRDFVKCDSKNAQSFAMLLHEIDPDVYVETHVSNGADYQYTMTYLSTQPDKLNYAMGDYLRNTFNPALEAKMKAKGEEMVPYVNHHGGPLKDMYSTFYDSPRYSSGLTTLHHIYGFITETHMLKPYKQRVEATYTYLLSTLEFCAENALDIIQSRKQQKNAVELNTTYALDWEIKEDDLKYIKFKGYEYDFKPSEISGEDRLYYDKNKPVTKDMLYQHRMVATKQTTKPRFYILKQGYSDVVDRLKWNGISLQVLLQDTTLLVTSTRITDYKTVEKPYEKHYLHFDTKAVRDTIRWTFLKGDYIIPMGGPKDRFVVEILEPEGPDSYFNWNFFDAVLQQKEWYSSYVFEDRAAELLQSNPRLKEAFETKKSSILENHEKWSAKEQLYWIYTHSSHYEKEHMVLPVFRVE